MNYTCLSAVAFTGQDPVSLDKQAKMARSDLLSCAAEGAPDGSTSRESRHWAFEMTQECLMWTDVP